MLGPSLMLVQEVPAGHAFASMSQRISQEQNVVTEQPAIPQYMTGVRGDEHAPFLHGFPRSLGGAPSVEEASGSAPPPSPEDASKLAPTPPSAGDTPDPVPLPAEDPVDPAVALPEDEPADPAPPVPDGDPLAPEPPPPVDDPLDPASVPTEGAPLEPALVPESFDAWLPVLELSPPHAHRKAAERSGMEKARRFMRVS